MNLFNTSDFMPHGHCYMWRKDILILNVASDIIIALCYLLIPCFLGLILYKRRDLPFRNTIKLFAVFIFFCAITHIMEVINIWLPYYTLTGIIKAMTSLISIISTYVILKNLSKILTLPSLTDLGDRFFSEMNSLMDKLPIGIIFSSKTGKIQYANDYVLDLFNYSKKEIYDQDVEILIPENIRTNHYKYKEEYLNSPVPKLMGNGRVLRGLTKDKQEKLLEIGLNPTNLSFKDLNTTIVAIKDITNEEKQRVELEKTLKIINITNYALPSLLSYIGKNGQYEYVNDAYTKNWLLNKDQILGVHYKDFLPAAIKPIVEKNMKTCLSGKEVNFKIKVNFPKKGPRQLDVFYIPHISEVSGEVEGAIVLAHDITELNQLIRDLQFTNQQLEEFAFLVSHDLRAPARHVSNFSELLGEAIKKNKEPEKIEKYLKIITENSQKMQDLISGMLKISAVEQMKPFYQSIQLQDFFKSIIEQNSGRCNLTIKNTSPSLKSIEVDKSILEIILENLIQNSIKFHTKNYPTIDITLSENQEYLILDYSDNGPGVPDDLKKKIFKAFVKSSNSDGLGLGMAIVQKSINLLGGSIELLPSKNGVKFSLSIKKN